MKATITTMSLVLLAGAMLAGCGAQTVSATGAQPTPTPGSTPAPDALPQLRPANLASSLGRTMDPYEPNDSTPWYLGSGPSYSISDAYIDPVDVKWSVDVVNDGGATSASFDVVLHVNDKLLSTTVDGIGAGEVRTVFFNINDCDPGTVTAWAEVDYRNDVVESDEGDNASSSVDTKVDGDEDRFSVYQISGGTLSVTLDQIPADYDLELLDPNGTLVASSRNAGLTAESVSTTANVSGEWIVRVVGYNGARSASAPYHLQISAP